MINARILNTFPNARVTSDVNLGSVVTPGMSFGGKGYCIGLLLALTYTAAQVGASSIMTIAGAPPHIRIKST